MAVQTGKSVDRIYFLVVCFIIALFAEGILRRWVIPGLGYGLVFIRDPILLLIYVNAVLGGFVGRNVRPMAVFIVVSAIYFAIVLIQISSTALNPLIPAFGYRTYLLYFPLPFIMHHFLNRRHFENIINILIWCSVPIGVLTAIQYYSSPSSIWNIAPEGFGDIALIEVNRVRPYSVFTNSIAHVFFALIALCVFMRFLFSKRSTAFPALAVPIIGLTTVAMGALSGSRTYFILAPLIIVLFMFGALSGSNVKRGANTVFISAIVILTMFSGVFFIFPDAIATLINRQQMAVTDEGSTLGRLTFMGTDFVKNLSIAQPFGAGAGLGTNIGSYIYAGRRTFAVTEYELTRIVLEFGPTFGLVHIILRFAFVAYLLRQAMLAARRGELLPIALMGVIIPLFTAGPLTTQNTLLSIGWLAAGLCLLACKPTVGIKNAPKKGRLSRKVAIEYPELTEVEDADDLAAEAVEAELLPPPSKRGGLDAIVAAIGPTEASAAKVRPKRKSWAKSQARLKAKPKVKAKPKTRTKAKAKPKAKPASARSRAAPATPPTKSRPRGGKAPKSE